MIEILLFISISLFLGGLFVTLIDLIGRQASDLIVTNGKEVFNIHKILDVIMHKRTPKLPGGHHLEDFSHRMHFLFYCFYVGLIDITFVLCICIMIIMAVYCIFKSTKRIFKSVQCDL